MVGPFGYGGLRAAADRAAVMGNRPGAASRYVLLGFVRHDARPVSLCVVQVPARRMQTGASGR